MIEVTTLRMKRGKRNEDSAVEIRKKMGDRDKVG